MKKTLTPRTITFFSTAGTNFFIQACTLLQGILLARMLGPEGRGEYAAVIMWPTLFAGIGALGVNIAIARRAGKSNDLKWLTQKALLSSFITSSLTVAVCLSVLPLLLPVNLHHLLGIAEIFTAIIPLLHFSQCLMAIEQGAGHYKALNISRMLMSPVFLIGLYVLWINQNITILNVSIALLVGHGAVVAARLYFIRNRTSTGDKVKLFSLFKEGFPFSVSAITYEVYQRVDLMILVWLLPATGIGLYTAAFSAASVTGSIPLAVSMVCFTMAAQTEPGEGFGEFAAIFRKTLVILAMLSLAFWLLIPMLLPIVFGSEFDSAVPVASWLLIGTFSGGLTRIADQFLRGHGNPYAGLIGQLACILSMGLMGIVFVGIFNLEGMAIAYSIGHIMQLTVIIYSLKIHFHDFNINLMVPTFNDGKLFISDIFEAIKNSGFIK